MGNNGAIHQAKSDINNIRNILLQNRNQQNDLIFIFKEIVQNADDCKARHLSIGYSQGLTNACHPLLKGPGILIINDGPFSYQDDVSIRSIGSSTKEADSSTIGKFGIGLKTVFYICEAFFYLKGPRHPEISDSDWEKIEPGRIFNLWDGDDDPNEPSVPKSEWDNLKFEESDQGLIEKEREVMGFAPGFTIWLPLRQKVHCQRENNDIAISEQYPGDNSEFSNKFKDNLLTELAELLPLLKCLENLAVYDGKEKNEIKIITYSNRCFDSFSSELCQRYPLQGMIGKYSFTGYQEILNNSELNNLKESEKWPTLIPDLNGETKKQKAAQHCGFVILSGSKKDKQATITIKWAVFLPTSEKPTGGDFEKIDIEGDEDYIFTLHGFFFLNPDRSRILDWSTSDENNVNTEWNRILAQQGTFPLILPSLKDFAQGKCPKVIRELTNKFQESELWKNYQEFICSKMSWVYVVHFDNTSQWEIIASEETIYTIPELEFLIEVLPGLEGFSQSNILTYNNYPSLGLMKSKKIPADTVAELILQSHDYALAICSDVKKIETLVELLEPYRNRKNIEVIKALKKFLKIVLVDSRFDDTILSILLDFIPSSDILYLEKGLPEELSGDLLRLQEQLDCLIVPYVLNQHNKHETKLENNDALKIFQYLEDKNTEVEIFIFQVIDYTDNSILENIKSFKLFKIELVGKTKEYQQSLNCLQDLLDNKKLFSNQEKKVVKILAKAVHEDIYITNPLVGKYLKSQENLPNCTVNTAISFLQTRPKLSNVDERISLFELLKQYTKDTNILVIRYLLHGKKEYFDNQYRLYKCDESNKLWYKVLKHLFRNDQEWRFISNHKFLDLLSPDDSKKLNIHSVDLNSVKEELKNKSNISEIDWHTFNKKEREELISNLDSELVKQLCIHESIESPSKLVVIDKNTYLESSFLDQSLAHELGITLIKSNRIYEKYKSCISPLTGENILTRILTLAHPGRYWKIILNVLKDEPDICNQVTELKTTKWLPCQNDQHCRPDDVICISKLKDKLVHLTAECDFTFITVEDLAINIQNHPSLQVLKDHVFPDEDKALQMLGLMLSENKTDYLVGKISPDIEFSDWLCVFDQISSEVMLVVDLLKPLTHEQGQMLFDSLKKELNFERLIRILQELAKLSENKKNDNNVYIIYCEYLTIAVKSDNWDKILPEIQLLNDSGKWKSSQELCYSQPNIASNFILKEDLTRIIEVKKIEAVNKYDYAQVTDNNSNNNIINLREYFSSWPRSTHNAIAVFLSCLGKEIHTQELACSYLSNAIFFTEDIKIDNGLKIDKGLLRTDKISLEQLREYQVAKFIFVQFTNTRHIVKNLLNNNIEVELESDIDNLLLGKHETITRDKFKLTILKINLEAPEKLLNILQQTTLYIIQTIYGKNPIDFEKVWAKWQQEAPPDIRYVQNFLLDEAITYLRQHQLKENSEIGEILRKRLNIRRKQIEVETRQEACGNTLMNSSEFQKLSELNSELIILKKQLRKLLEEHNETSRILLESIRKRIQDANYDVHSILFEIFQNADDACYQLREMGCKDVKTEMRIKLEKQALYFIYWGRGINQKRWGANDYSHQDYDQDLIKMLLLNFSNKREGVTGKFGLGFKSVYLISDSPKVISDRLGFEIIGGLYPQELNETNFNALEKYRDNKDEGTVIQLPLLAEKREEISEKIDLFKQYVPLLGAFSLCLKEFKIGEQSWKWKEVEVNSLIRVGELIPSLDTFHYGLILGSNKEKFFFLLGNRGIKPLADDFPTYWVTAPTRMYLGVGFAVNAMFRLDVGRSQLDLRGGGKGKNEEIAQRLTDCLGNALIELFNLDFSRLQQLLHLTKDITFLDFWTSIWEVLGVKLTEKINSSNDGFELLFKILWSEKGSMTRLYQECDVLPTGLFGEFNCLTKPCKVEYYLEGVMDEQKEQLETILLNYFKAGQLISESVAETWKKLTKQEFESLDILSLIKWELDEFDNKLTPEAANNIWELLQNIENTREILERIKFKTCQDYKWDTAENLLAKNNHTDEDLIINFAPLSNILDESYQEGGLKLFYRCRQWKILDEDILVDWIKKVEPEKRNAALKYLIEGRQRDSLIKKLKDNVPDWLKKFEDETEQEKSGFSRYSLKDLLCKLNIIREEVEEKREFNLVFQTKINNLEEIWNWWKDDRDEYINQYNQSIYPDNWQLNKDNYSNPEYKVTRAWLALFLLGTCQSMGRQKSEQHRQFIQYCQDWGWFRIMTSKDTRPEDWSNLLDGYFSSNNIGERLKYYQWVRNYPAIYALAKWWEVYRDNILLTNKEQKHWDIREIFRPEHNNSFQGSGIGNDAPPLDKMLGIGTIFVMRELLRAGIITNPKLNRYGYVPTRRVREFLEKQGCSGLIDGDDNTEHSITIYDFLVEHLGEEKATFCGDYDLPFIIKLNEI